MDEPNSVETFEQANNSPSEPPQDLSRIAELENLLALEDRELSLANSRITELEQGMTELNGKLAEANGSLAQAVAGYKSLVIKSNPLVMEELISGDTIEAINASLEKAKTMMARVRQGMEEEAGRIKIPAGAPQRTPLNLSTLSPREKIQYGIGGKR